MNKKYISIALGFIVLAFLGFTYKNSLEKILVNKPIDLCFSKKILNTNTKVSDEYNLKMHIDENAVTGQLDFLPSEKDKKTGAFSGTTTAGMIDAWWNTSAEGMNTKEELSIAYNEDTAKIGFGEMKDRGDGIYVYADKSKIAYTLELKSVDCTKNESINTEKPSLTSKTWTWDHTIYSDDKLVKPLSAKKFTITFGSDKRFSATTDCNSVGGEFGLNGTQITFTKMMSTLMYCANSQENDFAKMLEQTQSYMFTADGELVLLLKFDSGSVIFK